MADPILGFRLAQQGKSLISPKTPPSDSAAQTQPRKTILRYPLNKIQANDDYLKIDVVEYKPPGLGTSGKGSFGLRTTEEAISDNIKNSKTSIILPMPQGIQDSNAASWGEGQLNPLSGAVVSAASGVMNSENLWQGIGAGLGNLASGALGAAKDSTVQKALSTYFSGKVAQSLLGQDAASGLLQRATGVVFNQNVELLFNGVQIRSPFQFVYDLVPRSKKESDTIKDIIRTFKKEMTPAKGARNSPGGGLFVRSPNVFNLTYMSGGSKHPFLHSFKPCALLGMSVDYTGAGTYATYSDATPVHLKLSLQFQELSIIYSEDYTKDDIGVGY